MGVCAIFAALSFTALTNEDLHVVQEYIFTFSGPFYLGMTVSKLKELLELINRKTILQVKIEDIQDKLNFETYMEEERGKKL